MELGGVAQISRKTVCYKIVRRLLPCRGDLQLITFNESLKLSEFLPNGIAPSVFPVQCTEDVCVVSDHQNQGTRGEFTVLD